MRCLHESSQHEKNSFITLSYNDDHLSPDGSLNKLHLQKFFKRLRHHKGEFRYYACGEYGDTTKRAHYHALIFGLDFSEDRKPFYKSANGGQIYVSQELEKIWGKGHCQIGPLNWETASYTARYVMKKQMGKDAQHVKIDEYSGEIIPVQDPFAVMSLKPAIGRNWIEKYYGDIYNLRKDYIYINGHQVKPPKYYDKVMETLNPDRLEDIKEKRRSESESLTQPQMRARETITRARISRKRKL